MKDVVVPLDRADDAPRMAAQAIARYRREPARIHLVNVQRPLPRHIARHFGKTDLHDFHREAGLRELAPLISSLDEAGVPHEDHVLVGKPAEAIVDFAEHANHAEVLLDDTPESVLSMLGLGSVGSQVRRLMTTHGAADASLSG
ncbi:MAG TPA: universal stress protein [Casimicrobiaceae bacterium]|jgi:hypothetical protein